MNRQSSLPLIPITSSSSRRTRRKFLAINPEDPKALSSAFNRQALSTRHSAEAHNRFDFLKTREGNRNSTVPEYKGQVGLDAKMEFYETYKEISKFTHMNRFLATDENPNIAYLREIRSKQLAPAPFGVVKRKGEPHAIDVKKMGMGDSYAVALSQSLKHLNTVKKLNLHSNRLTERGSSCILTTLKVGSLIELNLSENQIGSGSVERIIDILSDMKCELKRLILEKTNLSSSDIVRICEELEMNNTVSKLNLAKNAITGAAVNALASLISGNTTIKYLDLHWNNIRGKGSINLFKALSSNKHIKVLDISWNSMGNNETTELAYAISDALANNKRLSHLDLSYNYFNKKESDTIAKGLKSNHTIYGLHMLGNECALDSRGFIVSRTIADGHFTNQPMEFRRIIDEPAYSNRSFNSNCWLCDKWVEYTFYWRSGASGAAESEPLFLHLDVDNYHPEMMKKGNHGVFSLTRAMPQREVRFFYSHIEGKNIIPMLNKLIKVRKLDDKMTVRVKFWEGKIEDMNVMSVNSVMPKGQVCNMKHPFNTVPRLPVNSYTPPEKEPERIMWSIPISLFKDYKLDSEVIAIQTHLNKCFEFDWNEGKIPNFVKNPEDLLAVKEMLRSNYKHM